MTAVQRTGDYLTGWMRWIARLGSLLMAALFVLFVAGSGARLYATLSWSSPRGMPLLVVLGVTTLSALAAWRWEMTGGIAAVVGAAAVAALVYFGSGGDRLASLLMVALPLLVVGALFLGCCRRTRSSRAA
jgi:Na+/melibiose symporter-like transporter